MPKKYIVFVEPALDFMEEKEFDSQKSAKRFAKRLSRKYLETPKMYELGKKGGLGKRIKLTGLEKVS